MKILGVLSLLALLLAAAAMASMDTQTSSARSLRSSLSTEMHPLDCVAYLSKRYAFPKSNWGPKHDFYSRYSDITSAVPTNVGPADETPFHGNFIPNPFRFSKTSRNLVRNFINKKIYSNSKKKDKCRLIGDLPQEVDTFPGMILTQGPQLHTILQHLQVVHHLKSPVVIAVGPMQENYREKFSDYFSEDFCVSGEEKFLNLHETFWNPSHATFWNPSHATKKSDWKVLCEEPEKRDGLLIRKMTITPPQHKAHTSESSLDDSLDTAPKVFDREPHTFTILHIPGWPDKTAPTKEVHGQIQQAFKIVRELTADSAHPAAEAFTQAEAHFVRRLAEKWENSRKSKHSKNSKHSKHSKHSKNSKHSETRPYDTELPENILSDYEVFEGPMVPIGVPIAHCSAGVGRSGTFGEAFMLGHFLQQDPELAHRALENESLMSDLMEYATFIFKMSRNEVVVQTQSQYDVIPQLVKLYLEYT